MGALRKADWREEWRERAWNLKEQGWKQKDIAIALGVSEGAVSQWLKRGREQGVAALGAHPPPGMKPRLTHGLAIATKPRASRANKAHLRERGGRGFLKLTDTSG